MRPRLPVPTLGVESAAEVTPLKPPLEVVACPAEVVHVPRIALVLRLEDEGVPALLGLSSSSNSQVQHSTCNSQIQQRHNQSDSDGDSNSHSDSDCKNMNNQQQEEQHQHRNKRKAHCTYSVRAGSSLPGK